MDAHDQLLLSEGVCCQLVPPGCKDLARQSQEAQATQLKMDPIDFAWTIATSMQ